MSWPVYAIPTTVQLALRVRLLQIFYFLLDSCVFAFLPFYMIIIITLMIQREELRARFPGVPGDLVNYFLYVAEEVLSHFLVSDF